MKKFKCYFHPWLLGLLDEQKIFHPNHDAIHPVISYRCSECGYIYREIIKKKSWKITKYIESFWGTNAVWEKVEPFYDDKKIWDGKKK